jgi:hypothetical protein
MLTPSGHLAALSGRKAALGNLILTLSAPPFPTVPPDTDAGPRHPWLPDEILTELAQAEEPVPEASLLLECGCGDLPARDGDDFELLFDAKTPQPSVLLSPSPYLGSQLGPLGPFLHWLALFHHRHPLPFHVLPMRGGPFVAAFRGAPLPVTVGEDVEALVAVAPALAAGRAGALRVALVHAGIESEPEIVGLLGRGDGLGIELAVCGSVVTGRVRTALASRGCAVVCAVPERQLVELAEVLGTGVFRTWRKALRSSLAPRATVHLHHARHWATRDTSTVDLTPDQARDRLFNPIEAYLTVAPSAAGQDRRTFLLAHPVDGLSDAAAAALHALIARSDAIKKRAGKAIPFDRVRGILRSIAELHGFVDRGEGEPELEGDQGWGVLGGGAYGKWIDYDAVVEAVDAALLAKHQISITTVHLDNSNPIF